jgi:hypothetical protein
MKSTCRGIALLLLAVFFTALCGTAQAQVNGLENGSFDTNLSGWEVFVDRPREWSSEDADGSNDSGSALVGHLGVSSGSIPLVLYQCLAALEGVEYTFGADIKIPDNQPANTAGFIFVESYTNDECAGASLGNPPEIHGDTVGEWTSAEESFVAPANTRSIRIGLGVFKPFGQSAEAAGQFDNVYLTVPEPGTVGYAMSASWYNPDESGHGIMIHLLDAESAWMCWFTFDSSGNPYWICGLGVIEGDTITFEEAFIVEGGFFPPNFDPAQVVEVTWGTIEVVFTDCDTGVLTWTTDTPGFESGEMPLARLTTLWGASCQ